MIGTHSVTLIPDPDAQAWGPILASNSSFTTDLAGWVEPPFNKPWHWAAPSLAVCDPTIAGSTGLARSQGSPILRDASTIYRIRTRFTVKGPGWVYVSLVYGKTARAAEIGNFWDPANAINKDVWFHATTAGSYTTEGTYSPAQIPGEYTYLGPRVAFDGAMYPTLDFIELNGQGATAYDISCLVDQVSIHHGRDDADTQPEASACTLDLSLDTGDVTLPAGLEVGGIIRVNTATSLTNSPRFVGRITDIALGWDEAGDDTPNRLVGQVMATSPLAELGRRVVGDVPWVAELDGARVARILSNAGVTVDPTYSDPGTVQLIARDVDAQEALALAQEAATSASGIVWETRSGEVRYADAMHRRGATAGLTLDACDIQVTPTWRRTTEGLINKVSIGYGVPAADGDQPRYTADNQTSVARYGRYELSQSTQLAALADATALGQMQLTRNSSPVWVMAALPVDVAGLSDQDTAALLGLEMHDLLNLTGLPIAGAAPTSASLWVEGWTETLRAGEHEMQMAVTGYCRTAPAPLWDDVNPTTTWASVVGTWDDWTCIGPTPSQGRWTDVPASLRWDQAPGSWNGWVATTAIIGG